MAMSADATNLQASHIRSPVRGDQSSNGLVRLSHLRKLRECEQAAAICYRWRNGAIEFLLVRTRNSGRWTFPKGSAEPGLTHAQAAALEAFEEAGVHGRIEEASFARYICRKRGAVRKSGAQSAEKGLAVNAYLCQVLRLGHPKESNRKRTWFSVEDVKQRLREGRDGNHGAEFCRLVDKAVARIRQVHTKPDLVAERLPQFRDSALCKVQFEALERGQREESSFSPYVRNRLGESESWALNVDNRRRELLPCEVLEFSPPQEIAQNPGWLPGRKKPKALGTSIKSG